MARRSEGENGGNGKKRGIVLLIPVLLAVVLLLAGLVACKGHGCLLPWQQQKDEEKSAAILAAEPIETKSSDGAYVSDGTYVPEESRQALLSMGEKPGTVYISWKGSAKAPKYLRYATDQYALPVQETIKAQRSRILGGAYYRYTVELTGLKKGSLYYYEIGDGTTFDAPRFFYAPDDEGDTVFAYFGDPQFDVLMHDYKDWRDLVWQMYKTNQDVEFVVVGGDLVNVPTRESQWNAFLDSCGLFGMLPVMTAPGNHEGVTSNATYKKLFQRIDNGPADEAFYFFDYGHCRFIVLDSSFLTAARQHAMGQALWSVREQEVERWLRDVLSESDKPWNIVVTHHPIYGMHDIFTVSPEIREHWLPILEEEGADLVLCGHQHAYMRTREIDGIVHVMGNSGGKRSNYYKGINGPEYAESIYAAGANYQVIRATKTSLELTCYDKENTVMDSVRLRASPWSRF